MALRKMYAKSSGDGGGGWHSHHAPSHAHSGVHSGHSHTYSSTSLHRLHNANIVLYLDNNDGVYVAKNRWGETGAVSVRELINILTRILVEHIFDGRMKLFQEMMRVRLKGAIHKIVKDGA